MMPVTGFSLNFRSLPFRDCLSNRFPTVKQAVGEVAQCGLVLFLSEYTAEKQLYLSTKMIFYSRRCFFVLQKSTF